MELSAEQSISKIKELESRLEEYEQLIQAIKAGEVDAFALNKNNQPEIFTLQSGDYAYRMLVENFGEGALNLSEEATVVYTNNYFLDLLELSYETLIGKSFFQFIHPESKEAFIQLFKKGLAGQSKGEITLQVGNRIIPVYVSLTSLYPTLPTVGIIVTDITKKKAQEKILEHRNQELINANEELSRNKNFIHSVLQSTNHGVLSYEAIRENNEVIDFTVTYANHNALEQLNLPSTQVVGNTYLKLIPKAKEYGLWQRVIRVLNTSESEIHEVISPQFPDRHFLVQYTKLGDGVTCTFIETTEQKLREQELKTKNELLEERNDFVETLINSSLDLIMVFDKEYTFLTANKIAEERFSKFYSQRIIGKKLTEVVPNIPIHDIDLAFTGKLHTVYISKSVVSDKCYEISYVPLRKKNEVYAVMVISHDITDQIKREEIINEKNTELEKLNKELNSFAYISSHDLQEPLRKIQTFATRIIEKEQNNLSDNGKDMFKRMQDAARRMQTLIEDLLAYSRTSTLERKFEKTDLNKIIDEVKEDLKEELKEKQAIIDVTKICDANIIPFQFRQLMHNLIGNSLKFYNPNHPPHIKIKCEIEKGIELRNRELSPDEKYCHITVTDNGIGFEQQYSERIFEVFQRLHGKTEYKGTGIGLSIVKKIIENHNGIITATSELNKGATFDIYIPTT